MLWECKEGHQWDACFRNIKNNKQWCPYCSGRYNNNIEECHKLAAERGGKCLSTEYKDSRKHMLWECKEGHQWPACFHHIKNGKIWCPKCGKKSMADKLRGNLEECQKLAEERGGKCLSTEYKDCKTKMLWNCGKGHQWDAIFSSIKSGKWCPKCGRILTGLKKRCNLEECHKLAEERGGKCLSTEYKDNKTDMLWECKEGHQWDAVFSSIKNCKSWCPDCSKGRSEKLCRQILEEETGLDFPSIRPNFLNNIETNYNLELDGYCEDLNLAFEYQGRQHYEYSEYFHRKSYEIFEEQQKRDRLKLKLCKKNGIDVIIIPYTLTYQDEEDLRTFIIDHLEMYNCRI